MIKKISFSILSALLFIVLTGCDSGSSVVIDKKSDEEVKIDFIEENTEKETAISVIFAGNTSEKELYTIAKDIDAEVGGYLPSTNAARFIIDTRDEEKIDAAIKKIEEIGNIKDVFISE